MKFFQSKTHKMKKLKEYKGEVKSSNAEEPDLAGYYNYADYLQWTFDGMVELINGKIFKMAPTPSSKHQLLSGNLFGILWNYLKGKPCQVVSAPFDVRLSKYKEDKLIDSVVQPDLCIICDPTKIDEKGCNGAPDMVIEILSPFSEERDTKLKYKLYEENGVMEYWIVNPHEASIKVYDLVENKYECRAIYHSNQHVEVKTIGLWIKLNEIF
jgi:Uma2 family endonuclease